MSRPLHDIADGTVVMLDANVIVYALTPASQFHSTCRDVLARGAQGTVRLLTTVVVAADVLHRAMVLEVLSLGQVQRAAEAVTLLKRQPQRVMQLTRYRTILRDLRQAQIDILPLTYRDLHTSRVFRERHGLLTNDSLLVAVMQRERIQVLATNDPDFERIPGIAARMPT